MTKLYDFNHSEYRPVKSKAYLRVVENKNFGKNPKLERLEKARKAIETRKHYSEIVKDIFFKDALLNNQSGQQEIPKQIVSLRDIKEEAEKKRLEEFEHHKLMHEIGKRYLEEVRHQNVNVTPQARKKMDEKRFMHMKSVDKPKKSRKYLDQIARDFKDPRDVVVQKDQMRKLNPTRNTDSHNAFVHNVKYFDEKLIDHETKLKYKATKEDLGLDLGDKYINSIQNKLTVLEKETNLKLKDANKDQLGGKKPDQANPVPGKSDGTTKTPANPDSKPKDAQPSKPDPKDNKDPKDPKATDNKTNPTGTTAPK